MAQAEEIASLGCWEIYVRTGAFSLSATACRIFGWDENVVSSITLVLDAVHPDDRAAVAAWLSLPREGHVRDATCFFRLPCQNGAVRSIYGRSRIAAGPTGAAERLIGTVQDMTDFIELQRTIHHEAQFYRGIFENAVWGIFQTTVDGRYLAANTALARIYGYDAADELLAVLTNIGDQLYVDPTRRATFIRIMREKGVVSGFESQVYRRDGSVIWISESCREVRASDGHFLYYEGMVEEVTERKRTEEELRLAMQAAEAASRAKSDFLGTMSHELRTPLNAIIGFSEVIHGELLGPVGVPAYKNYAADVISSGRHLLTVINDILDFAKAEAGKLALREEILNLPTLVEEAVRFLRQRIDAAGLQLSVDLSEAPPALCGDELRLRQVLLNLIGNAIKFTPKGGSVEIRAHEEENGDVTVAIRDTGIGMHPADLARVFDPFYQVDGGYSRNHEGTGLGLAICDRLMRLHGGRIALTSELGRGTVAAMTLPAGRAMREVSRERATG